MFSGVQPVHRGVAPKDDSACIIPQVPRIPDVLQQVSGQMHQTVPTMEKFVKKKIICRVPFLIQQSVLRIMLTVPRICSALILSGS